MEAGPQTEAGNPYASAIAREVLFAGILNEYFPDRMKSSIVILSEVDATQERPRSRRTPITRP